MITRLLFVLTCVALTLAAIDPLLSSPGNNSTVVVFMDIHTSYHDNGTCSSPDWQRYELAQYLLWKNQRDNVTTGIHIYDTCSSPTRARRIMRESGLYSRGCSANDLWTTVSGVFSYTSLTVSDVISGALNSAGILHVSVGTETRSARQADDQLIANLASRPKIDLLVSILTELNWKYVTTITDKETVSRQEHDMFVTAAKEKGICVQFAHVPEVGGQVALAELKTKGVVAFVSSLGISPLDLIVNQVMPPSTALFVVSPNAARGALKTTHAGIIMEDEYMDAVPFADYMTSTLWNQTAMDLFLSKYYTHRNCLLNSSTDTIACPQETHSQVTMAVSTRGTTVLSQVMDLMAMAAQHMVEANCSSAEDDCVSSDYINSNSRHFSVADGVLSPKPPFNITLTLVNGGNISKIGRFSFTDLNNLTPSLTDWAQSGTAPLPASTCENWCPECQNSSCTSDSKKIKFPGDSHIVPGDIVLTGLFPMSKQWNVLSDPVCEEPAVDDNMDILVEAYMYAIRTAHARYPDILPQVDVGAAVFDTCSSTSRATQVLFNFESCRFDFDRVGFSPRLAPEIVPANFMIGDESAKQMSERASLLKKLDINVDMKGSIHGNTRVLNAESDINFSMISDFLKAMDWSLVGVLSSPSIGVDIDTFSVAAAARNICLSYHNHISKENNVIEDAVDAVTTSPAAVVVLFATTDDLKTFFNSLTKVFVIKTYIVVECRKNVIDIRGSSLPLGTLVLQRDGVQNTAFNEYIKNVSTSVNNSNTAINPWLDSYKGARDACADCALKDAVSDQTTLMRASDIIKAVDITLHAIHRAVISICGNTSGLCQAFVTNGRKQTLQELDGVSFMYQNETVKLMSNMKTMENCKIINIQTTGDVQVGSYADSNLQFQKDLIVSYNSVGGVLTATRPSFCFTTCKCINIKNTTENVNLNSPPLDAELGYKESSAKFENEQWALIVVIVAGVGCLFTILFMIYILCKICSGALIRRYLALGLLLMFGLIFMFLSVLPFVFTPSEPVCGMRYFAHGVSYAFSFAVILTKMMTLRDYKYIGLGGEISRLNQLLTVFFITGVQIALGVQWWVLLTPILREQVQTTMIGNDAIEQTFYACDFNRGDFIAYHSYVMFLIVVCCFYSISVRRETKNMKEARLLLVCCWFCLALWIALCVTIAILPRDYIEAICAIGLLANALSMFVIILLPKLTAISRLKYEVSEQDRKENGYKIDPDFQYERPYSLPGTMRSHVSTEKTQSYPRSLTHFDTSLSY